MTNEQSLEMLLSDRYNTRVTGTQPFPAFYVGSGDSKSGLHDFVAIAFPPLNHLPGLFYLLIAPLIHVIYSSNLSNVCGSKLSFLRTDNVSVICYEDPIIFVPYR